MYCFVIVINIFLELKKKKNKGKKLSHTINRTHKENRYTNIIHEIKLLEHCSKTPDRVHRHFLVMDTLECFKCYESKLSL